MSAKKETFFDVFTDRENVVMALAVALSFLLRYRFKIWGPETSFDRTFNQLGRLGLSLDTRTDSFFAYYFLAFPAVFLVSCVFFGLITEKKKIVRSVMTELSAVYLATMPFLFLIKYSGDANRLEQSELPLFMVGSLGLLAVFSPVVEKYLNKEEVYHLWILSLAETFSGVMLLHDRSFFGFFTAHKVVLFAILFTVQLFFVVFLEKTGHGGKMFLSNFSALAGFLPFVICASLELVFILIARGYVILHSYLVVVCLAVAFLAVVFPVAVWRTMKKKKSSPGYFAMVLGVGAMIGMPVFSGVLNGLDNARLFEMGNVTSFVDTFISGDIPGVNYFSAHMFSDSWMNVLYYVLNGDLLGAVRGNYSNLSILFSLILLYFLLRDVLEDSVAFLLCLLFPFYGLNCFGIGLNFLPVLALAALLKKNDIYRYVLFWATLLLGVLFQLDHGLGIGLGVMAALAVLVLGKRIKLRFKAFFLSMAGVSAFALFVFLVGCLKEGVSFPDRLMEFISVTMFSNSGWAVESLGDSTSLPYFIVYCVVPVTAVILLGYLLTDLKNVRSNQEFLYSLCLLLCVSQIVFASRTLVLYTLGNGVTPRFFSYFPWLMGFFAIYLARNKSMAKIWAFGGTFLLTLLLQETLVTGFSTNVMKVPMICAEAVSVSKDFHYELAEGTDRTVLDGAGKELVQEMNDLFDTVMTKEDTFLDFADVSGLYGLLYREHPCYVSQSPSLLTTEKTQEQFIREIEKNGKAKLALLAAESGAYLDAAIGIKHSQRYFLVADYIFTNYRPLVRVREYAVWCRMEEYDAMAESLKEKGYELLSENYGDVEALHTYEYGHYAWLWANADKKHAADNEVVAVLEQAQDGTFTCPVTWDRKDGNYLKFQVEEVAAETPAQCVLFDQNGTVRAVFGFTLLPGDETYLIRCSNDYVWFSQEELNLQLVLPEGSSLGPVEVLIGN